MLFPYEHKTVQAQIIESTEVISWTLCLARDANSRGGSIRMIRLNVAQVPSYYSFKVLFGAGTREFNPRYADAESALLG